MIHYIDEWDRTTDMDKYDVVLLPMNITYDFSDGFQLLVSERYPEIVGIDERTGFGDMRKLGKRVGNDKVSLMYVHKPNFSFEKFLLDYKGLENALRTADSEFVGKKVLTTLAFAPRKVTNWDRKRVVEIFENNCRKTDFYICRVNWRIVERIPYMNVRKNTEEFKS